MKVEGRVLNTLVMKVAAATFGCRPFQRRPLMLATEAHLRSIGAWTFNDDMPSASRGIKSEGLAKTDWAISHLYAENRIVRLQRNLWTLAPEDVRNRL